MSALVWLAVPLLATVGAGFVLRMRQAERVRRVKRRRITNEQLAAMEHSLAPHRDDLETVPPRPAASPSLPAPEDEAR